MLRRLHLPAAAGRPGFWGTIEARRGGIREGWRGEAGVETPGVPSALEGYAIPSSMRSLPSIMGGLPALSGGPSARWAGVLTGPIRRARAGGAWRVRADGAG